MDSSNIINYTMNKIYSITTLSQSKTRRSQRRKHKHLQCTQQQYQIPNPYRSYHTNKELPLSLGDQLSKFDSLSMKNLESINFISSQKCAQRKNKATNKLKYFKQKVVGNDNDHGRMLLNKMRSAANRQQLQFEAFVKLLSSSNNKEIGFQQSKGIYSQDASEENNSKSCQLNLQGSQKRQLESIANIFNQDSEPDRFLFYPDQNFLDQGIMHDFKLELQNCLI